MLEQKYLTGTFSKQTSVAGHTNIHASMMPGNNISIDCNKKSPLVWTVLINYKAEHIHKRRFVSGIYTVIL